MKKLFMGLLLVGAIVYGYMYLTDNQQQAVVQGHEKREQMIMSKEKQFMDKTKNLGQQLQNGADSRMQQSDSKSE